MTLECLVYEVETAGDGEEAVEKYVKAMKRDEPFDGVILDLTIHGGMGGKEVFRQLREINPHLKAIVASGYSNDPVMAYFRDYGFRGVLPKPFEVRELGKAVQDMLDEKDN